MTTDKRADAIFRKLYHLKGSQVKAMQNTYSYQRLVLNLLMGDLWQAIKQSGIGSVLLRLWLGITIGIIIYKLVGGIL